MMENERRLIKPAGIRRAFGLALIALSFAFYGGLLLVTFVSASARSSALLPALFVICGEASFWIGVLIIGKEAASKYRDINWRRLMARFLGTDGKSDSEEGGIVDGE